MSNAIGPIHELTLHAGLVTVAYQEILTERYINNKNHSKIFSHFSHLAIVFFTNARSKKGGGGLSQCSTVHKHATDQ